MLVAMRDDIERSAFGDSSDIAKKRPGGCIEIDANTIHAALNHCFERLLQLSLGHIVLILTDTDRFGIDLHQLREWILKTTSGGDGPTNRQVKIRELLASDIRCRVDAGSSFTHCNGEKIIQLVFAKEVSNKSICLAGSGSVTDGNGANIVLSQKDGQGIYRSRCRVLRGMEIKYIIREKLSG